MIKKDNTIENKVHSIYFNNYIYKSYSLKTQYIFNIIIKLIFYYFLSILLYFFILIKDYFHHIIFFSKKSFYIL